MWLYSKELCKFASCLFLKNMICKNVGMFVFVKSVVWYKGWNKNEKGGFQTPCTLWFFQAVFDLRIQSYYTKDNTQTTTLHPCVPVIASFLCLSASWAYSITLYTNQQHCIHVSMWLHLFISQCILQIILAFIQLRLLNMLQIHFTTEIDALRGL